MQPNVPLRDMNIGAPTADDRRVEVLASGLADLKGFVVESFWLS